MQAGYSHAGMHGIVIIMCSFWLVILVGSGYDIESIANLKFIFSFIFLFFCSYGFDFYYVFKFKGQAVTESEKDKWVCTPLILIDI